MPRRKEAQPGATHRLERLLRRRLARSEDLGLGKIDTALGEGLAQRGRLRPAGDEDENALRIDVLGALHERRAIGICDRKTDRPNDVAPGFLERALECRLVIESMPLS